MEESLDYEVISRWEALGMLDNLPLWEKEELAILYDNTVRLILSDKTISKIPSDVDDVFNTVNLPIVRRLYRRVGPNFDISEMLGKLLEEVQKNMVELKSEATPEKDPIIEFCKTFADNYEDEKTMSKQLSKEEYAMEVDLILTKLRYILLNNKVISNINKTDDGFELNYSNVVKSENTTRFLNQKMGYSFLSQRLTEINKGL